MIRTYLKWKHLKGKFRLLFVADISAWKCYTCSRDCIVSALYSVAKYLMQNGNFLYMNHLFKGFSQNFRANSTFPVLELSSYTCDGLAELV